MNDERHRPRTRAAGPTPAHYFAAVDVLKPHVWHVYFGNETAKRHICAFKGSRDSNAEDDARASARFHNEVVVNATEAQRAFIRTLFP
jgi:hypothetical protein